MTDFIRGEHKATDINEAVKGKASIIDKNILFSPKLNNGLGLQQGEHFWKAIKMGWLRRLSRPSFWKTLHFEDLRNKKILFIHTNPTNPK